jgi:hypothetical protein
MEHDFKDTPHLNPIDYLQEALKNKKGASRAPLPVSGLMPESTNTQNLPNKLVGNVRAD